MKKLLSAVGMSNAMAAASAEGAKVANRHPDKVEPKKESRQVRRQKERLAKKPSLVNPKRLGRER